MFTGEILLTLALAAAAGFGWGWMWRDRKDRKGLRAALEGAESLRQEELARAEESWEREREGLNLMIHRLTELSHYFQERSERESDPDSEGPREAPIRTPPEPGKGMLTDEQVEHMVKALSQHNGMTEEEARDILDGTSSDYDRDQALDRLVLGEAISNTGVR